MRTRVERRFGMVALIVPALVLVLARGGFVAPRIARAAEGDIAGDPGKYTVRVLWKEAPLPGAQVEWRRQLSVSTPEMVGATIGFGVTSFRPAAGPFFVTAEWRADGDYQRPRKPGDRFAYFGGNPVLVAPDAGGELTLTLEEVPPLPSSVSAAGTGVSGRVTVKGVGADSIKVFAYQSPDTGFRDAGFRGAATTDQDGQFRIDLPPGRYYLLVRQRAGSRTAGPMHKGDLFGYDPMNPVEVRPGGYTTSAIPAARLKMINTAPLAASYKTGAIIQGRITDRSGAPKVEVYAALYDNPDFLSRPLFHSDTTGADGKYKLTVPVPGTYYLGARDGYGGAPLPGGWLGRYGGSADHTIILKAGERLEGVDLIVEQVP